jgi:hypothetical protein
MNRFALAALILFFSAFSACSSAKPPAAAAVQGNKTMTSLRDLSDFFQKKNHAGFMSLIADDFKDRKTFSASIQAVFSRYEAVHCTIQYSKMVIMVEDKGMIRATFNWNSDWRTAGGSLQKNSGRATFVFDPKNAKLVSIDGTNPFIPQAVQNKDKQ